MAYKFATMTAEEISAAMNQALEDLEEKEDAEAAEDEDDAEDD